MPGHLLRRAKRAREPGGNVLLFTGAWSKLRKMSYGVRHRLRLFGLRHRGVDRPRRWLGRPLMTITGWAIALVAVILVAWMLRSVYVVFFLRRPWSVPPNDDALCRGIDVSCGAISGWITSLLSIALASVIFLFWRFWRMDRRYRAKARQHARELVPTAGPIFGKIVGRDDLCRVLMEDLRDGGSGLPHVLVGGVGTGKTAVVVLLTEMLAKRRAIPVPIRLRDAETLDFSELAKDQFMETVNERLASAGEGEKVWRRLLQDGRIVVLADGLEEALSRAEDAEERDSKIRIAIRKAYDQGLPLLIASRPHTPLREMDATIHELEALSKDAALTYVAEDGPAEDERRLSWIVETADVADSPLYLQITKEIYRLDLLDQIATRKAEVLGTPGDDPSELRVRLLQTWKRALIRGDLRPDVPLRPEEREVALVWLSALACIGLKDDSLEVRLDAAVNGKLLGEVKKRLDAIDSRTGGKPRLAAVDRHLAAAWGARLGLVEPLASRVRFQHSLIQAFLGSQLMGAALRDHDYVKAALYGEPDSERTGPGREFLIALVLHSRTKLIEGEDAGQPSGALGSSPDSTGTVCYQLAKAAGARHDNKALDIYAAAMEISSIAPDHQCTAARADDGSHPASVVLATQAVTAVGSRRSHRKVAANDVQSGGLAPAVPGTNAHRTKTSSHLDLAVQIHDEWLNIRSEDPQTLEEAKLGLVSRFGEALHMLAARGHHCPPGLGYAQLYDICRIESSYRIRLAAAQEIGRGGAAAFEEIEPALAAPGQSDEGGRPQGRDKNNKKRSDPALHGRAANAAPADGEAQWAQQVSAWLAPLLLASVDAAGGDHGPGSPYRRAEDNLRQWRKHVQLGELSGARLPISQEIALAQGFKYAANRRYGQVHSRPAVLGQLQEEALEMLKHARYWFSQLTLIQALCLWEIQPGEATARGQWNPDAIVNHWLEEIDGVQARDGRGDRRIHPFVEAAAVLAARALETGHPERFLWMDESDLVTRVGSSREVTDSQARRHDQWIQPSMGWSGLDRHAQQLVADVLLLLNLAERGEQPGKIEQWLERANRDTLPPCIKRDRLALKPDRTVGTAASNPPGSNCLNGCPFDLCPYPPKGQQPHRAELSEAFCRHQYMLVRRARIRRSTARWQGLRASQMRTFWSEMANRARIGPGGG